MIGIRWRCLVALFFIFPFLARATQTQVEARKILTTGVWHWGSGNDSGINHVFAENGTFTSNDNPGGTWKIYRRTLTIYAGNSVDIFPLPIDPKATPGSDASGNRVTLSQDDNAPDGGDAPGRISPGDDLSTPERGPRTNAARASALIQEYNDSLVFVSGSAGDGSGFIATMGSNNFLITNVHVAAGIRDAAFKTLSGVSVRGGLPSMAVGEDIFCMAVPDGGKPLPIMSSVESTAAVGDSVVVLGNGGGAGVLNRITGNIVGIGPNLVEVSAPFVPGNSGSPIIHLKSGKVIGVATYLITNRYDLVTKKALRTPVVRRFGYRLDTIRNWQRVDWRSFYSQAGHMEEIEAFTDDLYRFFGGGAPDGERRTHSSATNTLLKSRIAEWNSAQKGGHSPQDVLDAETSFLSYLKSAALSDVTAARSQFSYDYFARELSDQTQTRQEMARILQSRIEHEQ